MKNRRTIGRGRDYQPPDKKPENKSNNKSNLLAPVGSEANGERFMPVSAELIIKLGYYGLRKIINDSKVKGRDLESRGFAHNKVEFSIAEDGFLLPRPDVTNIPTTKFFDGYKKIVKDEKHRVLYNYKTAKEIAERDLVPFYFTDLRNIRGKPNQTVVFRSTIKDINDKYTPEWKSYNYLGNPSKFYTFSGYERSLDFSFIVMPYSDIEFLNVWRKVNKLMQMVHPVFRSLDKHDEFKVMEAPLIALRIGDLYDERIGFIESISIRPLEGSAWETDIHTKNRKSSDIFEYKANNLTNFASNLNGIVDSIFDIETKKENSVANVSSFEGARELRIAKPPKTRAPRCLEISISFKFLNINMADSESAHFDHIAEMLWMDKYDYDKEHNTSLAIDDYINRQTRIKVQEDLANALLSSIGSSRALKSNTINKLLNYMSDDVLSAINLAGAISGNIERNI